MFLFCDVFVTVSLIFPPFPGTPFIHYNSGLFVNWEAMMADVNLEEVDEFEGGRMFATPLPICPPNSPHLSSSPTPPHLSLAPTLGPDNHPSLAPPMTQSNRQRLTTRRASTFVRQDSFDASLILDHPSIVLDTSMAENLDTSVMSDFNSLKGAAG